MRKERPGGRAGGGRRGSHVTHRAGSQPPSEGRVGGGWSSGPRDLSFILAPAGHHAASSRERDLGSSVCGGVPMSTSCPSTGLLPSRTSKSGHPQSAHFPLLPPSSYHSPSLLSSRGSFLESQLSSTFLLGLCSTQNKVQLQASWSSSPLLSLASPCPHPTLPLLASEPLPCWSPELSPSSRTPDRPRPQPATQWLMAPSCHWMPTCSPAENPTTATGCWEPGFPPKTSDPASAPALPPTMYSQRTICNNGSEGMLPLLKPSSVPEEGPVLIGGHPPLLPAGAFLPLPPPPPRTRSGSCLRTSAFTLSSAGTNLLASPAGWWGHGAEFWLTEGRGVHSSGRTSLPGLLAGFTGRAGEGRGLTDRNSCMGLWASEAGVHWAQLLALWAVCCGGEMAFPPVTHAQAKAKGHLGRHPKGTRGAIHSVVKEGPCLGSEGWRGIPEEGAWNLRPEGYVERGHERISKAEGMVCAKALRQE